MSSQDKDPREKHDTPSDSSESHSDKEVEKAEENLEQLQIEEKLKKDETKEESEESKPMDSPNQEGTPTSNDELPNEPMPGPSGLQNPNLESSEGSLDEDIACPEVQETKGTGAKPIVLGAASEREASESPAYLMQSNKTVPMDKRAELRYRTATRHAQQPLYRHVLESSSSLDSSSSRQRTRTTTDDEHTSADVSELRTEVVEGSAEGSVYHDAPENLERDQSLSEYLTATESQSTESSDTNASELQEDSLPLSGVSISTPSGEQGHRAYLDRLLREAEERGEPLSTSSGIGSTNQSELEHLQRWQLAGEMGGYRRNDDIDYPLNPEVAAQDQVERPQQQSGSAEGESNSEDVRLQDMERLFQQGISNEDENREANLEAEGVQENSEFNLPRVEECKQSDAAPVVAPAPAPLSRRKKPSLVSSDSSSVEKEATGRMLRSRSKPDVPRKPKIANISSIPLQSSSESNEPQSSSSDGSHRKESPDIKSSSEAQEESSHSESGKKAWQQSGRLRAMQHSTMSSIESVITEEEEPDLSRAKDVIPEVTVTREDSPKKMETSPRKPEDDAPGLLESTPSVQDSSSETRLLDPSSTSMERDLNFEVEEERTVGKSKRTEAKLSTSPPSDDRPSTTPLKGAAARPRKKSRQDKKARRTRRTRKNSDGSLKDVGRESSTSTPDNSDYVLSDDDKEAAL